MNVLILDVSGKVPTYDKALYSSISGINKIDTVCLSTPYMSLCNQEHVLHLYRFVPFSRASSTSILKRLIKAVEVFCNYIKCSQYIKSNKVDVLHLQWLPFLEINEIEYFILKLLKRKNTNLKIILTIHNIFPHNSLAPFKAKYVKRFNKVSDYINHYIVHTQSSLNEFINTFDALEKDVTVIKHGVFSPDIIPPRTRKVARYRLLMFGNQENYKGTDLFIKAAKELLKNKDLPLEFRVVGKMSSDILNVFKDTDIYANKCISWRNDYISDSELYQEIVDSDALVYPYRKISQSGALLLGLNFKKTIILSDLPSFKETMENYPNDLFFKTGDYEDLIRAIMSYINMCDEQKIMLYDTLNQICKMNSWQMAGQKTLHLYHTVFPDN